MPCAIQDEMFFYRLLFRQGIPLTNTPCNTPDRLFLPARALKERAGRKREDGEAQTSAFVGLRQSADAPNANPASLVLDSVLLPNS